MKEKRITETKRLPLLCLLLLVVLALISIMGPDSVVPTAVSAGENEKDDANRPAVDANQPSGKQEKTFAQKKVLRPEHDHPAFKQRVEERKRMVAGQIRARGVSDPNVLASLSTVPRHAFVRSGESRRAYSDQPLPIGMGQTISQPYIVAYMTAAMELDPNSRVLEIGTGSGYQAAVCAEIVREVYTIEIINKLAESASLRFKELGYRNVFSRAGDGYFGWQEKGPFDAIIITAAAPLVPPPLKRQLKSGGRMILPLGTPYGAQTLVLITKDDENNVRSRSLLPVRFVPMVGRVTRGK